MSGLEVVDEILESAHGITEDCRILCFVINVVLPGVVVGVRNTCIVLLFCLDFVLETSLNLWLSLS